MMTRFEKQHIAYIHLLLRKQKVKSQKTLNKLYCKTLVRNQNFNYSISNTNNVRLLLKI